MNEAEKTVANAQKNIASIGLIGDEERNKRAAALSKLPENSWQRKGANQWMRFDVKGKQLSGTPDYAPVSMIWNGSDFEENPAYHAWQSSSKEASKPPPSGSGGGLLSKSSGQPLGTMNSGGGTMTPGLLSTNYSVTSSGQNVDPVTRTVTADELASSHLDKLLGKDSALRQRAETSGMQYANSRGLLNSSIAAGAAFGEFVDRASPIAQQDATRYGQVADKNMDATNTFRLADKQFTFDSSLQKDDQAWRSGENVLDRSLTKSEGAADRAARASESAADIASRLQLEQMGIAADDRRFDKDIAFRTSESALDRDFDLTRDEQGREFTADQNQMDRDFDRETQMTAAEIDADARLTQHLYDLEELGYRFDLDQYNVSKTYAANTLGNFQTSVAQILADPNLEPAAKTNAINNLVQTTNDMLKFGSSLYGTNLPGFGSDSMTVTPNAPAPSPGGNFIEDGVNEVLTSAPSSTTPPVATSTMVSNAFQNATGRAIKPEGMAFWSNVAQQNGWTQAQLEAEMAKTAEAQAYANA